MFERRGDLLVRQSIDLLEDPNRLCYRDQTDETRAVFRQAMFHDVGCFGGLNWVILCEVADKDVRVEPDHLRFACLNRPVAPCTMAASISSRDALRRARTIPFRFEMGTFGKITTLPSGW